MKKCAVLFFFVARFPAYWFWKGVAYPIIALVYRTYLAIRKSVLGIYGPARDRAVGFFTSKYITHVAVFTLTFLVTGTNIYASEVPQQYEKPTDGSVLSYLTQDFDDDILIEEAADEGVVPEETSMEGAAVSAQEYYSIESIENGTDDGMYSDEIEDVDASTPFDGSIRMVPEMDSGFRPPTRTTIVDYVVQDGDTVAGIAMKFGLKTSSITLANDLGTRGLIRPGQTLRILPVDGLLYKVKKGDTLLKIAKTYRSDTTEIADANVIAENADLAIGTELILPGGRLPAPPPAPKAPSRFPTNLKDVVVPPPAADRIGKTRLLWPTSVRRITQYYKRRHTGLDIAGPVGTPIYAADDGTVIFSGWNRGGYGNLTIIEHGDGLFTRYAHATKNLTKVGDTVRRGDVIALMGSTGRSTGPHLHFEVMVGSVSRRANPFDYTQQ